MKNGKEPKVNGHFVKFICICLFLTAFSVLVFVLSFSDIDVPYWLWWLLSVLFLSTIAGLVTVHFVSLSRRWKSSQKQVRQVKVTSKRREVMRQSRGPSHITYFFTFEFPDGESKEFSTGVGDIVNKALYCIVANDTGTLVYQELEEGRRKFISFERDGYCDKTKLSLYDRIYSTYIGSCLVMFLAVLTCVLIPSILAAGILNDFYLSLLSFNKVVGILPIVLKAVVIFACFYIPKIMVFFRLRKMPVKEQQVKVVESGDEFSNEEETLSRLCVFELPDGERRFFTVYEKQCKSFPAVNDTGTLFYRELGNDVKFVAFEATA